MFLLDWDNSELSFHRFNQISMMVGFAIFTGVYFDQEIAYIVKGTFRHIPKGVVDSAAPDFDLLLVSYNIFHPETGVAKFQTEQFAKIFITGDVSSIGDIKEGKIEPFTGIFFTTLKQIVISNFQKLS